MFCERKSSMNDLTPKPVKDHLLAIEPLKASKPLKNIYNYLKNLN